MIRMSILRDGHVHSAFRILLFSVHILDSIFIERSQEFLTLFRRVLVYRIEYGLSEVRAVPRMRSSPQQALHQFRVTCPRSGV
jgi:hypothetical protein